MLEDTNGNEGSNVRSPCSIGKGPNVHEDTNGNGGSNVRSRCFVARGPKCRRIPTETGAATFNRYALRGGTRSA